MTVEYAIHHAVGKYPGGAGTLSILMEISASSLSHKANPLYPGAHCSPRELINLMTFTGDKGPLRAMAAELGEVCIPLPNLDEVDPDAGVALARKVQEFGELLTTATTGMADGKIKDNELALISSKALDAVAAIHAFVGVAARMNRDGKPKAVNA